MPNPSPSDQLRDFLERAQTQARLLRQKYTNLLRAQRETAEPEEPSSIQPTIHMPVGTVFRHNDSLYRVIERGGGFDFACPWKGSPEQKVALNPRSMLAKFYPVIETGEILPEYARKVQLLDLSNRVLVFVFESAPHADDIAELEAALAYRSGCRLRTVSPTLSGLHDGASFYRLYSVHRPDPAVLARLDLSGSRQVTILPYEEGPYFWEWVAGTRRSGASPDRGEGVAADPASTRDFPQ